MSTESRVEVFNALIGVGCCRRCGLRYTGDNFVDYDDPENYIKNFGLLPKNQEEDDEQECKKMKLNPCPVCLDVLQDNLLSILLSRKELQNLSVYDSETFVNYISLPKAVLIREHSMEIYMKEKFPEFFKEHHITAINKAWTLSLQSKLAKVINKKYDKSSNLTLQFITYYKLEQEESSVMYRLEERFSHHHPKSDVLSRNVVADSLKTLDDNVFRKHVPIPPEMPSNSVALSSLTCYHEPIFIAGRYCKYSRCLGQSPWVIEKVKIFENSVQEIIFKPIEEVFNCRNLVFSSSGREDFDVRTLGRGRPFFVKLCDSKLSKISFDQFRYIERQIKKSNLVSVRDLQFIDKKALANIKEGEQEKQKSYRALCIIDQPDNLQNYLNKINNTKSVILMQKTPIRVFHRRSASTRKREIFSMKAIPVPDRNNLFELDLVTQAGTYVKEFVHGDLGRTQPSLITIIGGKVDILTLDVLDIHIDFPPSIATSS